MPDARNVAEKLGVRILFADSDVLAEREPRRDTPEATFSDIWQECVMPLAGRTLRRPDGATNEIVSVDWSGLWRISSEGNRGFVKIEIFEWAVERLLRVGYVSRDDINQQYTGRASRAVVLVLEQIPRFVRTINPDGLALRTPR